MYCSRCVLSLLGLYLFLEVTAGRPETRTEVSVVEQEQEQTAGGHISVGDLDLRPMAVVRSRHNQRTMTQKRRKVAPLDSIGSSLMFTFRKAKD